MRPIAALFVAMLLLNVSALAHADSFYNYAGFVSVNGVDSTFYPDGTYSEHVYNNQLVAASLTIHKVDNQFGGYTLVDNYYVDLPTVVAPVEIYTDFDSCYDFYNCISIFYRINYNPYANDGPDPLGGVLVNAVQSYGCTPSPDQPCFTGEENYSGVLTLVTGATPEPSTFALLGTGLLGVAATLRRRFA